MGDFTEAMLEGLYCQCCGETLYDNLDDPPGFPQSCEGCAADNDEEE